MKVKTVATTLTTNSAGQVVESVPVLPTEAAYTDTGGRRQDPVAMVEDALGTPIRIVSDAVVLNSAGKPVAAARGKGVSAPLLSKSARIVALGDSITQYGTDIPGSSVIRPNLAGELIYAAALSGNYNIDCWYQEASTTPGWWGANAGIAGQTLTTIGNRVPNVSALLPDAVIIGGGTNDNTGFAQATADAYYAMAVTLHDAGVKHVFLRSIWPKGPGASTGTTVTEQRAYNAALKAYCDANPSWLHYINIFDLVTNPDGTPLANVLYDDLHPTGYGQYLASPAVVAALAAVTETTGTDYLTDNFWATGNILTNPTLTGTGGSKGTGVTGSLPNNWAGAVSGGGGSTVVASVVANAETGGQTLVLDVTPGAGSGTDTLTLTNSNVSPSAGGWLRAWLECEVTDQTIPFLNMNNFTVPVEQTGLNSIRTARLGTPNSLYAAGPSGRLKSRSHPGQHSGSSTAPTIQMLIVRGGAPYQVKIHRAYVGATVDPHITWGQTAVPVNTAAPSITGTPGVGNVLTVNPGSWSNPLASTQSINRTYRYDLYRNGVFVSRNYATGSLSYTQVAGDSGTTVTFKVAAANISGRGALVDTSNSVVVP